MSRARVHEVSSPISLFPFIGILLCTMGALLVVLVAVSRSARDTAQRDVHAKQSPAAKSQNDGVHQRLDEVKRYVTSLNTVRSEGERKLRDEQLRLSHVEDHIRRLHEKMRSLETAATELEAMEKEHYDDRKQAEREIERLHQLIEDSKKTITSLQDAGSKEAHSYAVIPYEGPNGTFRRPIYIECIKNELVIQPEGIHIGVDDLRPPFGPGNPLASVLRASRDYLVRLNPGAGQSRDTEPYPLLLVRSDGLYIFDRARSAIEAGDFDLGFELVENDWKVKYPQSDPQLADVQQQTLAQARARQAVLVASAPRAYRSGPASDDEEFDSDDESGGEGSGGSGAVGGVPAGTAGGSGPGSATDYLVRSNNRYGTGGGSGHGGGSGEGSGDGGTPSGTGGAGQGNGNAGSSALVGGGGGGGVGGSNSGAPGIGGLDARSGVAQNSASTGYGSAAAEGAAGGTSGASDSAGGGSGGAGGAGGGANFGSGGGSSSGSTPGGPPPAKSLLPDGYESSQNVSMVAGSQGPADENPPNAVSRFDRDRRSNIANRGKDWALREKPARAIPVRRTIRVAVRNDQLAIVPDSGPPNASGKTIPFKGDTVESIDEFVKQVHQQIDGWGMAGNGLYWRPVILLNVGPDGGRRADDLARLLKNSGLEIRNDETARSAPQGAPHETR